MSPLIQIPDYALKLQRRLGLPHLPDSILAPETVGVVVLDDLTLRGTERKCQGTASVTSAVAEIPIVALQHATPAGTVRGYAATCTRVLISSSAANNLLQIGLTGGAIAGLGPNNADTSFLDQDNAGRPATQIRTVSAVALPASRILTAFTSLANVPYSIPIDFFFGSDVFQNTLFVASNGTNVRIDVTFEWSEE